MAPVSSAAGGSALRQALAISIVQNKRKRRQELELLEAKAEHLEAELKAQRTEYQALQSWAKSLLQPTPQIHLHSQAASNLTANVLPALLCGPCQGVSLGAAQDGIPHEAGFTDLQQQASIMSSPAKWLNYDTLQLALDTKTGSLCSMLLANIQMLQKLHSMESSTSASQNLMQPSPLDTATLMKSFILDTLLEVPARYARE